MQRVVSDGLVYYTFAMWAHTPFKHGIFTRHGGVSTTPWDALNLGGTVGDAVEAVAENHRRMYQTLDVNQKRVCTVWQVHGADTVIANEPIPNRKWLNRADGMVTNQPGTPLAMRFADCVPLLFYDSSKEVIGVAHAGWRGTLGGAQLSVIDTMREAFGCNPADIQVGIGPSIGPDHYQVGEEVVEAASALFDDLTGVIRRAEDGSAYLNLWEANRRILEKAGVGEIEVAELCTATHTDEFFSHRAEKGKTGRFGAVVSL